MYTQEIPSIPFSVSIITIVFMETINADKILFSQSIAPLRVF
jgi:hypothetical protein